MIRNMILWFAISGSALLGSTVSGQAIEATGSSWTDLQDEPSRAQLGDYEMENFAPPGTKAARRNFVFPVDSNDGVYGIDISHHNGSIDWKKVEDAGVQFVYIKATQGKTFRDGTFMTNWSAAGKSGRIRRGAYHFLSAGVSGKEQANSYLALLKLAGGLGDADLTPVLDMEWDFAKANAPDRWAQYSSSQIAAVAAEWLETVKKATGRTPMIYTSRSWWQPRLGTDVTLKNYPQWLNDFRTASFANGAPMAVASHQYRAWQFTDVGKLSSGVIKLDVNRLRYASLDTLSGK